MVTGVSANALPEDELPTYVAVLDDGSAFSTLQAAADAAQAGDAITLLSDVTLPATLVVAEGKSITLNLAGYDITTEKETATKHYYAIKNYGTLTTNYLVVFNGAYIADGSDDNSGLLACPKAHAILEMHTQAEDGVIPTTQAPLWDASQNGFVFVQFAFAGMDLTEETLEDESTVLVYRFAFLTETGIARDLLADGGSDNEMSVLIRLSWTNGDGTETHDFVVGDALLGEVVTANGTRQFALSITNYADYENLQFQAIVLSGEHIVAYTSLISPQ